MFGGLPLTALIPRRTHRDELVAALPVAHIFGFTLMIAGACSGMPVYFMPKFNPVKVLDAIETRRASIFGGVPAMYRMMLEAGAPERNLKSIRMFISGADAMPQELSQQFKKFGATTQLPVVGPVGDATFVEGYGMVETGGAGWLCGCRLRWFPAGAGRIDGPAPARGEVRGRDPDGNEVPVGTVGELYLSGPSILKGYHGAPEAWAQRP